MPHTTWIGPLLATVALGSLTLVTCEPAPGCDADRCQEAALELKVAAGDTSLSGYQLIVTTAARPLAVDCPDRPQHAELRCTAAGAELGAFVQQARVVLKAPGQQTLDREVRPTYQTDADACGGCDEPTGFAQVALQTSALPAFETTADYSTGFDAISGPELFADMAYAVVGELGTTQVVKFYIDDLRGSPQVYFQNTRRHPIHYTFVRTVLGHPLTLAEFEAQTYRGEDRTGMAGSIIFYPTLTAPSEALHDRATAPITIEFFPSDDLTPEQARRAYLLIEERLLFAERRGVSRRLFYAPAGSVHEEQLASSHPLFAGAGALWLRYGELYQDLDLQLLNPGLAYGTLQLMTPEQLERQVVSFQDILVLTRLPNLLPIVGGTITEELQTPLAHVNVAARARGTPNIALRQASQDPRLAPLIGQLVRFEVDASGFSVVATTLDEAQAFWQHQRPAEVQVPSADLSRDGLPDLAELGFGDAGSVGAKAANVAELSDLLDDHAPHGLAIPFVHYARFMAANTTSASACDAVRQDCLDEGRARQVCERARSVCHSPKRGDQALRDYAQRLLSNAEVVANSGLRDAALDGLRYLIHHGELEPGFAAELDARIASTFGSIAVRLRSSTNAEDLPGFSGAGLYRSLSVDGEGPTLASDRVRRVWASVWSWRAVEERSFWNIDHAAVHMGVLVHQAFPDEKANGVLITQNIADLAAQGMYINVQLGEVSVTNPVDGALPEILSIIPGPEGLQVARQRFSSLSPAKSILSEAEIVSLYTSATRVQQRFSALYHEDPLLFALEIEFKFHGPERALIFKQARPFRMHEP